MNPFDVNNNVYDSSCGTRRAKFFGSFGSEHTLCYNNNPKKKLSGMNHVTLQNNGLAEVLKNNVTNNCDAYFYVNGARKKENVQTVRACYVDLDAGRDSNGQYYAPKVVQEHKKKFLEQINNFKVKPSWVVDTRNGYQVYWILSDNDHRIGLTKNKKYWNGIQKKLANYFNADIRAMKINQIFRVPFTWWRKPWEGKKSYFSTLLPSYDGTTVSMVDLQTALTGQSAQVFVQSAKSSDAWYEAYRSSKHTVSDNGVPISVDTAKQILQKCIINDHTNPTIIGENDDIPDYDESDESNPIIDTKYIPNEHDWERVQRLCGTIDAKYIPNEQQLRLLSSVMDFLNQVSTPLFFSNNKFLSAAAKDLAAKLSDEFCIG